jgi:hypothetical protein
MDEGRCTDAQDARAREDEDNGDCAQIEADGRRDEAESNETWGDTGGRSREASLKAAGHTTWGGIKCSHCGIYSAPIGSSLVSISGFSCKTMFNKELWTSSFPLYSIKPNLRNLFMKKLTRARVVPIISARVS